MLPNTFNGLFVYLGKTFANIIAYCDRLHEGKGNKASVVPVLKPSPLIVHN